MNLLRDFFTYLKAVFAESQRLIFTAFDIVGIVLFFFPHLAEGLVRNETLARAIGGAIFFVSFLLANFLLYRKSALSIPAVSEKSFLLFPYKHPSYNDIEMRYLGTEPIKDLEIWLTYQGKNNEVIRTQVEQFFPRDDPDMIWKQFKANVLEESEVIRFHLPLKGSAIDGRVTVEVNCMTAKTEQVVKFKRDFELKL